MITWIFVGGFDSGVTEKTNVVGSSSPFCGYVYSILYFVSLALPFAILLNCLWIIKSDTSRISEIRVTSNFRTFA